MQAHFRIQSIVKSTSCIKDKIKMGRMDHKMIIHCSHNTKKQLFIVNHDTNVFW